MLTPDSPEALAAILAEANSDRRSISLGGNFTKPFPAGVPHAADITVSTNRLNRVKVFEPKDLTISVEAGMRWTDLESLLAPHRMMIPLDPPYADATVGGVVASNSSGPRRRLFGSVRDLVIGMSFATLEGRIVQSGGMVVKNVAGLDMGKLMIGSFGTLAAIASVNFKLIPQPAATRTFVLRASTAQEAVARRDAILGSVLQPMAVDLLNPQAAERVGLDGWCLLVEAGGNERVLARYERELQPAESIDAAVWKKIREFTPAFLAAHPEGSVSIRSHTLTRLESEIASWPGPVIARAANGVTYLYQASGPPPELWPEPGSDFSVMQRIKAMMDPYGLLNRGRLYGRI